MIKLALANLEKYNNDIMLYKWVELPYTEEELEKTLDDIGIANKQDQYFIFDYKALLDEKPIKIKEIENHRGKSSNLTLLGKKGVSSVKRKEVDALNELAEKLKNIDSDELPKIRALNEAGLLEVIELGYILDNLQSFLLTKYIRSTEDAGHLAYKFKGFLDNPELERYLDYAKLGEEFLKEETAFLTSYGMAGYTGSNKIIGSIINAYIKETN